MNTHGERERIERQLLTLRHQALRARLEAHRVRTRYPFEAESLMLQARNLEVIVRGLEQSLHTQKFVTHEAHAV